MGSPKGRGNSFDAKFAKLAKFREVEQATASAETNTGVLRAAQDDNEKPTTAKATATTDRPK
jgi:hypothetical protein